MTPKLTKKQKLILDFIKDFLELHNISPSYREIMTAMNLNSVSAVAEHVNNLVSLGVVRKVPGSARSLELVDTSYSETTALFKQKLATASAEDAEILLQSAKILNLNLE